MTVDELQVLITANADQLRRELASAKSEISGLQAVTQKISKAMPKSFRSIGAGAVALGSVVAAGITTAIRAITSSVGDAVTRLDTLNNYPKVMSNLGIGADEAQKSINYLSDKLIGLPTTLDAAAMSVQRFTSANGNIGASTQMFLALNNAILAGGGSADIQSTALEQLSQSYAKGKPDMMEWRSAMTAMPAQLKQVATAMGYVSADALGESLRNGELSMNDFMKKIVELNQAGANGFQSFEDQARNATGGVGTSIITVKTALVRGMAQIMDAIGQANIAGFFQAIAGAINAVIPYIVAFVKVVVMAVSWVSALFGGGKKKADGMAKSANSAAASVGNVGAAAGGASDGLGSAAGKAKKLKKELNGLASFDEMNVLKPADNSDSGSGGGGGGAGGGGIGDLGDMGIGNIDAGLDKITPKVQAILDFFKQIGQVAQGIWNSSPVQAFVGAVGAGFNFLISFATQLGQAFWQNLVGTWQTIQPNVMLGLNNVLMFWTLFWQNMQLTIETWGQPFITSIIDLFNAIWKDAIDPAVQIAAQIWADFTSIILDTWKQYGQGILNGIAKFATKTVELFKSIWDNVIAPIIKPFLQALKDLWNNSLKDTIAQVVNFVAKLVQMGLDIYNKFIQPVAKWLLSTLKPAFVTVGSIIGGVFNTIATTISTVVGSIFKILGGLIDFLTGVFTGNWRKAWDGLKNIFKGAFSGLAAIAKAPLNALIDIVNGMIDGLNNIKIPDWVPGVGGKNLSLPKIPKLARGGVVDRATLAVVGENGREAVMPLENNTGWIDQLAQMIAARGGTGGAPTEIVVKIGEQTFARKIIDVINDQTYINNGGVITL